MKSSGPTACRRVGALAKRVTVTIAIDSVAGLDEISAAARESGQSVGALVDVNVGQNRCGVSPGSEAVALAKRIADAPGVELRGLMGYEGHAVGIASRAEREASVRRAMEQLVSTAGMLADAGLPPAIVSAGGTGSYDISGAVEGITEIQAGSYALMDTDYARLGLPFEHALSVLGTVISRAGSGALRRRQRPQVVHEGPWQPVGQGHPGRLGAHAQRRARDDCASSGVRSDTSATASSCCPRTSIRR